MSDTAIRPHAGAESRSERRRRWTAALLSALLHGLFLLVLLFSSKPVVTTPQGSAGGGRVKVDFLGQPAPSDQPTQVPPSPAPAKTPKPRAKPVVRQRADPRKLVMEAKFIEPPAEPEPEQAQAEDQATQEPAQAPASPPPEAVQRHPETWTGHPPGWLEEQTSPDDDGRSRGPANRNGYRDDAVAGEPSMDVGGFQIIYDLLAEARLRTWMEQGMKELSIPLPGTPYLMVCPAEVALRRGSSKCRLVAPGDPALKEIGDARQVISVYQVYRQGELVWHGPGPYR